MSYSNSPGRIGPPGYNEDPPSYTYPNDYDAGDTAMSLSGSRSDNTTTMRLLPAGSEITNSSDGRASNPGDLGSPQYRKSLPTSAQHRQYVSTKSTARSGSISLQSNSSPAKDLKIARGIALQEQCSSSLPPVNSSPSPTLLKPSSTHPNLPSNTLSPNIPVKKNIEALPHYAKVNSPYTRPSTRRHDRVAVPPPLRLTTPKPPAQPKLRRRKDSIALNEHFLPLRQEISGLFTIEESNTENETNRNLYSTPSSPTRNSSHRYHPLNQSHQSANSLPLSRPSSSLGNRPNIPPPTASSVDGSQFSIRPRSPTRPWTPSRGTDWPRAPPSASSVSYEPVDLNGSPRPGTPSSKYGGSPRRPLPPAPLFSVPASSATETTIDIGDVSAVDHGDDVFGGAATTIRSKTGSRASMRSYDSYMSDSTMVTDEKDTMSKIDLDNEEKDELVDSEALYGPAPTGRQDRRGVRQAQKTRKEVKLINGELVLECKIPTILHSFLPRRDDREFTHMRYTAVTCDPDDFVVKDYKLRQNIGSTTRETELFICVTMYNENEIDFTRTMHGIMRNISHFCSRTKSRTWGKDGWKKIVVCIIADGRHKVHPRTLNALAALGVYQDGIAKNMVNQKEVTAHVYEYTTQVSLDPDLKFKGAEKGIVPCQMIFCLKERNQKKLNSHRWFFNAFGRSLNPNVCILLDVGTKPEATALYHLWKAFDQDSNVAGAAGEIKAGKGKGWLGLFNPLVASQNFEYKMSNILDKPLESVFGYITVLPGALSAYRYHALQNDSTGHGPLSQYFKGEMLHGKNADVFTANMYLAEDRILCWELVAKREDQWLLKFVKSAVGETDVPDTVPEFISQRRRWLNGAFFAAVYSLIHFRQVWKTDHSLGRKILLHIEFIYQFVSLIFTFFSLANFYITFYFIAGALANPEMDPFGHNIGKVIFVILRYACILLICLQFILSMGNRPQGAKKMFLSGMIVYSIIMVYTVFAALYMVIVQLTKRDEKGKSNLVIGNNVFTNLIVSTLSTVGLYFLMSFLYLDPWHMFTSSAQYFALLPSYICTLQVYAFCNTHDVTWGTKGDNIIHTDLGAARTTGSSTVELEMPSEQLDIDSGYDEALRNLRDRLEVEQPSLSEAQMQEDYYRAVRTYMVSIWVVANAILGMAVSESYNENEFSTNGYLAFVLWSVAGLAVFRALGSTTFAVLNLIHKIAEGKMKFAAGNCGGSGVSAAASSALHSDRSTSEKLSDWISEAGWSTKRTAAKLAFWRK